MTGFQTSVQTNQAYMVPGTLLAAYPFTSVAALPGELSAGSAGVIIGRFAWASDSTGVVTNGKPSLTGSTRFGFVTRSSGRSSITNYLDESSFTINPGFEVTLYDGGHFTAAVPASGAVIGQKLYAAYADGSISLAATGSAPTTTGSVTTTSGSATISYTPASLTLAPGMPISATGIPANSFINTVNVGAGTATLATAAGVAANATASATVTATVTTAVETRYLAKTGGVSGDTFIFSEKGF